jgi:predicted dithiol-disulfide oxidoreductase (DUF899 family)
MTVQEGRVVEVVDWSRPELFEAFGLPMSFPPSPRSNRYEDEVNAKEVRWRSGRSRSGRPREALLAAERELEEDAKRVQEQRRELPWVPVEKDYSFATEDGPKPLPELFEGRSQLLIYHLMFGEDWAVACPGCSSLADGLGGVVMHLNDRDVTLLCMSQAPLERVVAYKRRRGWTVPYVSAHGDDFLFDYGYAFRREEMSGIVREEFDMGQLLREAPQWLRDYREDVGAPDLESAVSVSAGWSVFAMRDDAVYNTYRVYPHSRLITPLFSGLLELLPDKEWVARNCVAFTPFWLDPRFARVTSTSVPVTGPRTAQREATLGSFIQVLGAILVLAVFAFAQARACSSSGPPTPPATPSRC